MTDDHPLTTTIEPFTAVDCNGHEVFVLAGVFELRHHYQSNHDLPVARFPTRNEARAWQAKAAANGVDLRLSVRALEKIDITAAVGWADHLGGLSLGDPTVDDLGGWAA